MQTDVVLQTHHLKKYYQTVHAVEDVSLCVRRGEIFGFLGPNGAGKTTTIGMILGLIHPSAGHVEIFGQEVSPAHTQPLRRVGALIESPALTPYMSAQRNLALLANLYPELPAGHVAQVLELVGLADTGKRSARHFSTGMKQRLGLALALLNQPELVILDEPTNGMDPGGMHEIRALLRSLAAQGITVFLSSHLLHEIELICDRVAVVQRGEIIAQGTVADLLGKTKERIRITTSDPQRTVQALHELPEARDIQISGQEVEVQGVSSEVVMYHLVNQGITPKEVAVNRPDLESVFLELTQKVS
jgi:ABC-type multidrug transport system ATPase subunit